MGLDETRIIIKYEEFEGENLFIGKIKGLNDITEFADTYEQCYNLCLSTLETYEEFNGA
jgi:hypothetical protein